MAQPVQVMRLVQAIEQFRNDPPPGFDEAALKNLEGFSQSLDNYNPRSERSPGEREVGKVTGTDGTGEHYSKPSGPDRPSPGQTSNDTQNLSPGKREALSLSAEIEQAAQEIVEKAKGEPKGEQTPTQ